MNRTGEVDGEAFRSAMGKLAAAVHIVTAHHDGQDFGLTMTAVCSLSDDPPSLILSINRQSRTLDAILRSGKLCVNFLSASHADLALRFADQSRSAHRFAQGSWRRGLGGMMLLEDCPVSLECAIMESHPIRSHQILACEILRVHGSASKDILLYAKRDFGRFLALQQNNA